jgi:hypothetical protein
VTGARAMAAARSRLLGFAAALVACAAPAQQAAPETAPSTSRAQTMTQPAMPYACDLDAVPIGAWAEYEQKLPGMRTATERKAAVARGPDGLIIETTYWNVPEFVVAVLLAPGKRAEERLRRVTFQDGDYDPMDNPVDQKHQRFYLGLDAQTLIGEEQISIRAGTFHTRRYRYKTPFDETVDVWTNDTLWPICLIKLDAELKQPWDAPGRFNYELIATGTGATPKITRPAIPWDVEVLKKRGAEQRVRAPAASPPKPSPAPTSSPAPSP